jgi:sodium-dependent dicarboxylate transporter 2/3/5
VKFFLKWLLGPVLSLSFLFFVETALNPSQHRLVGILVWVVLWWITQPISLSATGLLGVSLTVALGVSDFNNAFGGFSHKVIFLLIGTFFLAEAMKVHRVDRAITYRVLSLNVIQNRPRLALFTILSLAGILSWWWVRDFRLEP